MLAFVFSWIVIFFVLFISGDFLILLYNKICKREEKYNIFDTLLLGMCLFIIPLSFWSFKFPSNHYFLFLSVGFCLLYCIVFNKRLIKLFLLAKEVVVSLEKWQIFIVFCFVISCIANWAWAGYSCDSFIYHHQAIRWNEDYKVVFGLGNLEDRLAFNSNYMLFSAIFTFRFLFDDAVYSFQGFFVIGLWSWLLIELFRARFEIRRILLCVMFMAFYILSIQFLQNTSTDILPNVIAFYLVAKYVLYPDLLKKNYLLCFLLPILLITIKLSFVGFGIISLFVCYYSLIEKKYKTLSFFFISALLVITPWLARNVILSGYLIYPVYQIDLFSVDWKIPIETAITQDSYIKSLGDSFFRTVFKLNDLREKLPVIILTIILYFTSVISFCIFLYGFFKKKEVHLWIFNPLFLSLISTLLLWGFKGPDVRFVPGVLCIFIFYCLSPFLGKFEKLKFRQLAPVCVKLITATFFMYTIAYFIHFSLKATVKSEGKKKYELCDIFYKPYPTFYYMDAKGNDMDNYYRKYPINEEINIYLCPTCYALDNALAIPADTVPCAYFGDYKRLEARGSSLEDGFRMKE